MAAPAWSTVIEQGARWAHDIYLKTNTGAPVDLTGYTVRAQFRPTVASELVLIELNPDNGRLVILSPRSAGHIHAHISSEDTAAFDWGTHSDRAVWDIELVDPSGEVTRLVNGTAVLSREVTR